MVNWCGTGSQIKANSNRKVGKRGKFENRGVWKETDWGGKGANLNRGQKGHDPSIKESNLGKGET